MKGQGGKSRADTILPRFIRVPWFDRIARWAKVFSDFVLRRNVSLTDNTTDSSSICRNSLFHVAKREFLLSSANWDRPPRSLLFDPADACSAHCFRDSRVQVFCSCISGPPTVAPARPVFVLNVPCRTAASETPPRGPVRRNASRQGTADSTLAQSQLHGVTAARSATRHRPAPCRREAGRWWCRNPTRARYA